MTAGGWGVVRVRMASEALAKEPEDSVVEDMRLVMHMIELALRNVDVAYGEEQNAYFRDVWSRLQSRLMCLRSAAMSSNWKPEFIAVLHRARYLREHAILPFGVAVLSNFDDDTDPDETKPPIGCFACANTRELSAKTIQKHGAFEIVGNPIWREGNPYDFLLTCPPQNLRERLTKRFKTDKRIASFDTEEVQKPHPFYRGMFVAGAKCSRLAGAFVWLQNFLPDLAHRIEKELEEGMTEEMLKRPPDEVSVITKAMAHCVVRQLEDMETFLREDVDRVEAVAIPPKLKIWDEECYIHGQEWNAWANVGAINGHINTKKGKAVSASMGGVLPDKPTWFEEAQHGEWTLVRWMWMCAYQDNLKRAMESMQTKLPDQPSPTPSAHSTPEEDSSEDEEGEEDDDDTTDETSEADERTLRRKRRERFRRKRRERTMQAESEPPPRRRRTAVVEDDDEQQEEEEEEEEEENDPDIEVEPEAETSGQSGQTSYDQSEMQMAVFEGQEAMLCEVLRRAHESAAQKMRLAVDQQSVAGTCKAQREYEAQIDMARHLQTSFGLGRIV